MKRKLSAVEARQHFGEILEGVYYRGDEVVIERAGRSMAAVISMERYEAMEKSRERLFELIEQNWERNAGVPFEQVQRDVQAAIKEVRAVRKTAGRRR